MREVILKSETTSEYLKIKTGTDRDRWSNPGKNKSNRKINSGRAGKVKKMNYKVFSIVVIGLILSNSANSTSIYKCTKNNKQIIFTDKECPPDTTTTVIHKETEQETKNRLQQEKISTIKRLIAGNQVNAAKEYAFKNNLSEVYYEQLSAYSIEKTAEEKQNAEQEKQQQLEMQQQALAMQRQQLAIERAKAEQQQQQNTNNQGYYGYAYYPYYNQGAWGHHHPPHSHSRRIPSQISSGGMNPPMSFGSMNPPMSFRGMNPPMSSPLQINIHGGNFHHR